MIPNFLVIGAQKAGTTWLDRNLRMHPEIWLPPEKEIHYFDLPKNLPFTFFVLAPDRSDRCWVINRLKRAYLRAQAKPENKRWYARYYFLPRTDCWYSSLFTPGPGQIAGEVTPHYAAMGERDIAKVKSLAPDIKLVYILRDPIDRMWSHAAMNFSDRFGYQGIDAVAEQAIARFLRSPKHLAQARYFANLQRWEKYFPPEQMFIGFYDEIAAAPERLLRSVFQFVGVDSSEQHISARANEVIFGRDYPPIPADMARPLAEALISDTEQLHQRLGSPYTAAWLASMQGCLAR
jgi:hypothetical protein